MGLAICFGQKLSTSFWEAPTLNNFFKMSKIRGVFRKIPFKHLECNAKTLLYFYMSTK